MDRSSGILLHISSLPGPYGIGTLGNEAYEFVDQLVESKTTYWQVLPLTPPGYSNSPYASTSAFANNISFIDPRELAKDGYLSLEDAEAYKYTGDFYQKADYEFASVNAKNYLSKAAYNMTEEDVKEMAVFVEDNSYWIHDYAVYEVLHTRYNGQMWQDWPENERKRSNNFVEKFLSADDNKEEIKQVYFSQWQFKKQWDRLRKYANDRGVKFIGDMPIFPALDSADVWSNPELFQLHDDGRPIFKAGVPPDYFSVDGQMWGNPLYKWEVHKDSKYDWWVDRVKTTMDLYDIVRIDHFRGFANYWAIPGEDENARNGEWIDGPGMDLFNTLHDRISDLEIIAEDLGDIDEKVEKLLEDSAYPGMKIYMFSFDGKEWGDDLPHAWGENAIAYTGTHDNATTLAWLKTLSDEVRDYVLRYARMDKNVDWRIDGPYSPALRAIIETLWSTNCACTVVPIQDLLGMDDDRKMNVPSTVNDFNWTFRLETEELAALDTDWLLEINTVHQRFSRHEFRPDYDEKRDRGEARRERRLEKARAYYTD